MMDAKQLKWVLVMWYVLMVCMMCGGDLNATRFEFSSPSSKLVLGDYNGGSAPVVSYFKNHASSMLIGWDQQSIVRGHPQANRVTAAWSSPVTDTTTVSAANAPYDLVVSASNMAPVVRGTSNWVKNQTTAFGNAALGRMLRGTSNWVNNQAYDLGSTSGGAVGRYLRMTSNAVQKVVDVTIPATQAAAQSFATIADLAVVANVATAATMAETNAKTYADGLASNYATSASVTTVSDNLSALVAASGASNVAEAGRLIRGTSNWVMNQVTDFGSPAMGRMLRGTSNWVVHQVSDFHSPSLGRVLRGTSDLSVVNKNNIASNAADIAINTAAISANAASAVAYADAKTNEAVAMAYIYTDVQVRGVQEDVDALSGGDYSGIGAVIRGSSQWIANNNGWIRSTSNWVAAKDMMVIAHENKLDFLESTINDPDGWIRGTSRAVHNHWQTLRTTSHWVVQQVADLGTGNPGFMVRTTSNAVAKLAATAAAAPVGGAGDRVGESVNYGSRIAGIESGLAQVRSSLNSLKTGPSNNGPLRMEITQNTYVQAADTSISNDNVLRFKASGGKTINFDGQGHRIALTRGNAEVIQLDTGVNAIVRNVVLNGFNDASVKLGVSSKLTFGDGAVIELGTDMAMARDWECTGQVTIRGFGSMLDMGTYGIEIKKDANGKAGVLIFEDILLAGVTTQSIKVASDSDLVTLRDVRVNMAKTTNFVRGALRVEHKVTLSGQHAFNFTTNNSLTIAGNSALTIDSGTVFAYAPTSGNRTLLVMENATARLVLNGCYFYAVAPGIQLTNGMLVAKSNNNLYNTGARSLKEAITLGNEKYVNNLFVDIQPGASLNVIEGKIDYLNVAR